MYKHNNANSSRLKTLIRYKIEFKKNMPFLNAITYTKLVSQGKHAVKLQLWTGF